MYIDHFLKNHHDPLSHLKKEWGVECRYESCEQGDLVALNYSQFESPRFHPIVDECRGLIVDVNTLSVVSRSFDRFYNYGECPANDIKLQHFTKDAVVEEKVDGSLCKLYFHKDRWFFSTRGTCFGQGKLVSPKGEEITYEELFERTIGGHYQQMCIPLDKECTYMFELACVENRIVTPYNEDRVVLLGVRHNKSGEEYTHRQRELVGRSLMDDGYNLSLPACYSLKSLREACVASQALSGLQEGFVVWDRGIRIKIKSPLYVKAHLIRGEGLTPKRIIDLILENEQEEYLTYFPQDDKFFLAYEKALARVLLTTEELFDRVKGIEDRKERASMLDSLSPSPILSWMVQRMMNRNVRVVEAFDSLWTKSKHEVIEEFL